jgi:hypothetical protein
MKGPLGIAPRAFSLFKPRLQVSFILRIDDKFNAATV